MYYNVHLFQLDTIGRKMKIKKFKNKKIIVFLVLTLLYSE